MAEVPPLNDVLMGALEDLDEDFKKFKLYLTDGTLLREFEVVKSERLKTEERTEVLEAMMDTYGIFTISVMKTVLKALHLKEILDQLSQYPYCPEAIITDCRKKFQSQLNLKFKVMVESLSHERLFHEVYTKLYIAKAAPRQISEEHEVRQMEGYSRTSAQEETIECQDIFKGKTETGEPIRLVLTKGVAGVGKTVLTQKFSLDWAKDQANQDIQLLFHFTFRELNKFKGKKYNLVNLLHHCFKPSKALFSFQCLQLLFIFDGLDECRLSLDFRRTRILTDPTESASVEELLVNLIRGDLLPFSRHWITTRPAAANQIPEDCISVVTEVRGFNDEQKEVFIRKRITDEQQATAVIKHIKSIRSLDTMSRIPIFCWILSTVLQKILEETPENKSKLPQTLTELYVHFLVVQAKVKNKKYEGQGDSDDPWIEETTVMVWALAKLAFEQLLKGNLIFSKCELSECKLQAAEIARYSVFKEIFREERSLYKTKVYCFIHLSMHEFLAALHVHHTFFSFGKNLLSSPLSIQSLRSAAEMSSKPPSKKPKKLAQRPNVKQMKTIDSKKSSKKPNIHKSSETTSGERAIKPEPSEQSTSPDSAESDHDESGSGSDPEDDPPLSSEPTPEQLFYRCAVDQALQSPNGHLDLFLRFLLGLSLPTNQKLLLGLITPTGSDVTNQETVKYIHKKMNEKGVSAERSLNLLHFLNELNDSRLLNKIQKLMTKRKLSDRTMSPAQWVAMSFILLSSHSDLEEFDLRKYCPSEEALLGLLPVVKASTEVTLSGCNLTVNICAPLASVLVSSSLKHLDLSKNDLQDSGVKLLCEGLKNNSLESLSLSLCGLTSRSCAPLASVVVSSSLTLLDLSNNDLQDSGVELLCSGLKSDSCSLEILRLGRCGLSDLSCEYLESALKANPSPTLTLVELQENIRVAAERIRELNNILRSGSDESVKELLLPVLESLAEADLSEFKFYLKMENSGIQRLALENASRPEMVQVLAQTYPDNSTEATVRILRLINKSQLAEKLSRASDGEDPNWRKLDEYQVNSNPRGLCLILNNIHFQDGSERKGADKDPESLAEVFSWLGFTVLLCVDQTQAQMSRVLRCFSTLSDTAELQALGLKEWSGSGRFVDLKRPLKHGDAFVCCILSHGDKGRVFGTDGVPLSQGEMTRAFTSSDSPPLTGKPKVFLIQASQGELVYRGVPGNLDTDPGSFPVHADFLFTFVPVEGYVSHRGPQKGSWFTQSLCSELKEGCLRGDDIDTILVRVSRRVAEGEGHRKTFMPSSVMTLTKKLILRPIVA